ncbi:MAG: hypothetical protein HY236_04740 [Acidobacteria bacterium]|nr:hypothetical protein [Acidobacteriota bacterium]
MWLLDANMDVHLLALLSEFGVPSEAATRRGWAALDNGELVSAAAGAGFTCLLTQDRLFGESAAAALRAFPRLSVVVVHLPQRPWREYREQFRAAWTADPLRPVPGRVVHWPAEED